ncbi:hypothetical protein [Spirosoma rigui]|uniref:hypothetical protein n=1 Tax=Spirosoma rigui TaxID=564064 RepID=UPI0009B11E8E|nr:hypothetical protein [Spirosoma rigui]
MKRLLVFLFLGSLLACQNKDTGPNLPTSDALYRSWQLTQVLSNGQPVALDPTPTVVTFPRDGSFRGALPNDGRWCCEPVAFIGSDTSIQFIWDTSSPTCALVKCRASVFTPDVAWQITTLNDTTLALTSATTTLTFAPVR